MYQVIVRVQGKRLQAETLGKLVEKLSCENIRLNDSELIKRKERLEKGLPVDILATRKLTRGELIKKSMRPPHLGNPFRHLPDTENVSLRITYVGPKKERMILVTDNKKCKCPLCEQQLTPENGSTPEEHLAKGIVRVYREMQDVQHSPELPCPRCGHKRMARELEHNALSRHADVYICDVCGADEALRAVKNNALPIIAWYAVNEILKCIRGVKCEKYIPEKNNPYPLCDNPACEKSEVCNISAHMADSCGYDK